MNHVSSQSRRTLFVLGAIATVAALIAAGCGGGGSSVGGSGDSPGTAANGLEYVAADAPVVVSVNTDFEADPWEQLYDNIVERIATGDTPDSLAGWLEEQSEGDESFNYEKISEWLGDTAGFAVVSLEVKDGDAVETTIEAGDETAEEPAANGTDEGAEEPMVEAEEPPMETEGINQDNGFEEDLPEEPSPVEDAEYLVWVDISDRDAARTWFEESDEGIEFEEDGDWLRHTEGDQQHVALGDEVLVFAGDEGTLEDALDLDESMADSDLYTDLHADLGSDTLLSAYIDYQALSEFNEATGLDASCFSPVDAMESAEAMSFGLASTESGITGGAWLSFDDEEAASEATPVAEPELLNSLPADTLLAISQNDTGMAVEGLLGGLADEECLAGLTGGETLLNLDQLTGALAQVEGLTGLDSEEIGDTFAGELVLAVAPGAPIPAAGLAWDNEEPELTDEFTASVTKAVARMAGGDAGDESEVGDFTVTSVPLQGGAVTIHAGSSEDIGVVATSESFVEGLGGDGDTLTDDPSFQDAMDELEAPDELNSAVWINMSEIADIVEDFGQFAGRAEESQQAGGIVRRFAYLAGWAGLDGDMMVSRFHLEFGDEADATSTNEGTGTDEEF